MVCQRAITLLREDSVARLAGSLASSAWYVLRRNPPCLPRRSIVSESRSSKESIPHCTHDIGERFIPGRTFRNNSFAAHICFPLGFRKDLIVFIRFIRNAWTNRHELFPFVERKATYLHSHHALTDPYCQQ